MGKKSGSGSGSGIQGEQPGSYFLEIIKHFFRLKYLNSLMRIRDGNNSDPGWKKVGSGINIPDPQHCDKITNFPTAIPGTYPLVFLVIKKQDIEHESPGNLDPNPDSMNMDPQHC